MLNHISSVINETIEKNSGKRISPAKLSFLCIAGSVEGGTTTFLAFDKHRNTPKFVIKIFREKDNAVKKIKNESEILKKLKESTLTANNIPKVLCSGEIEKCVFIAQSVLSGAPMPVWLKKSGMPDFLLMQKHFALVLKWLERLHEVKYNSTEVCSYSDEISKFIELDEEKLSLDKYLEIIKKESNDLKCSCIQHMDFSRQNILCVGPIKKPFEINVIDWTDSRFDGLPSGDLFYFLSNYIALARKRPGLTALMDAFDFFFFSKNEYSRSIRRTVESYFDYAEIDRWKIPVYFGLFLVRQAVFEAGKLSTYLKQGYMPRFNLSIAAENNTPLISAAREQLWFHLYLLTSKNIERFLPE